MIKIFSNFDIRQQLQDFLLFINNICEIIFQIQNILRVTELKKIKFESWLDTLFGIIWNKLGF